MEEWLQDIKVADAIYERSKERWAPFVAVHGF